eukprot:160070_1
MSRSKADLDNTDSKPEKVGMFSMDNLKRIFRDFSFIDMYLPGRRFPSALKKKYFDPYRWAEEEVLPSSEFVQSPFEAFESETAENAYMDELIRVRTELEHCCYTHQRNMYMACAIPIRKYVEMSSTREYLQRGLFQRGTQEEYEAAYEISKGERGVRSGPDPSARTQL